MELSRRSSASETGFSLIEALIAAAIMMVIALGLLPLFSRAINDNVSGNDASQATNNSRTQVEEILQLPFTNQRLVVPAGAKLLETKDYWTRGDAQQEGGSNEGWWTTTSGHGPVLWNRTTHVRQYSIADLADGHLDTPLDGSTQPTFVQIKQIEVVVDNPKKNIFGNGQGITLTVLKPF